MKVMEIILEGIGFATLVVLVWWLIGEIFNWALELLSTSERVESLRCKTEADAETLQGQIFNLETIIKKQDLENDATRRELNAISVKVDKLAKKGRK